MANKTLGTRQKMMFRLSRKMPGQADVTIQESHSTPTAPQPNHEHGSKLLQRLLEKKHG